MLGFSVLAVGAALPTGGAFAFAYTDPLEMFAAAKVPLPKLGRVAGFDGLRGLSMLLVFLEHRYTIPGFYLGYMGVMIFFCLSGFLIIRILHHSRMGVEAGLGSATSALRTFYGRRALRILPIYYLFLLAILGLSYLGFFGGAAVRNALPFHFLHLSNFYFGFVLGKWTQFSQFWSLAVEEQFYLLFAPLLLFLPARRHGSACLAVIAMGLLFQASIRFLRIPPIGEVNFPLVSFTFFGIAGLVAVYVKVSSVPSGPAKLFHWALLPVALVILLMTVSHGLLFSGRISATTILVMRITSSCFVVGWVVANQGHALVRLLGWRPLEFLGKISYGFYLFHSAIPNLGEVKAFESLCTNAGLGGWQREVGAIGSFLATLLISVVAWNVVEKPMLRLKERLVPEWK